MNSQGGTTMQTFVLVAYRRQAAFLQPLNDEKERECLRKVEQNDQEAFDLLVVHNMRLVAFVSKKYQDSGIDDDDLLSLGTIGLIKAVKSYRITSGTKFGTYAARCIENEILMQLRKKKKTNKDISMDASIGKDKEGNDLTIADVLGCDADELECKVGDRLEEERLRRNFAQLDSREKRVIALRYGLFNGVEYTQQEIARQLGISRSYVSRIEARALLKLQHALYPRPKSLKEYHERRNGYH